MLAANQYSLCTCFCFSAYKKCNVKVLLSSKSFLFNILYIFSKNYNIRIVMPIAI